MESFNQSFIYSLKFQFFFLFFFSLTTFYIFACFSPPLKPFLLRSFYVNDKNEQSIRCLNADSHLRQYSWSYQQCSLNRYIFLHGIFSSFYKALQVSFRSVNNDGHNYQIRVSQCLQSSYKMKRFSNFLISSQLFVTSGTQIFIDKFFTQTKSDCLNCLNIKFSDGFLLYFHKQISFNLSRTVYVL